MISAAADSLSPATAAFLIGRHWKESGMPWPLPTWGDNFRLSAVN
jgi:hypothetical protein